MGRKTIVGGILMKMKRVLSMALALSLIFGSAAALPEGTFTKSTSITASAEGDTIVSGDYKYKLLTNWTAEITEYTGTDATVTIPSALDTKTVSSIGANAFKDCADLKKVIIPKSVTAIGDGAFNNGCTIVCIPGSKAQEYGAFNGNELEYISGDYLYKDYNLDTVEITGYTGTDTTLTIPSTLADKTVESIAASAFGSNTDLKRVTIPNSVKNIEDNAFDKGCTIVCKPGSKAQEYGAFNGNKLEYISGDYVYKELDDETVEITEYLGNDAELTIPSEFGEKKVSGIGYNVFEKLDTLTSVTIPDGVANIKGSAFVGCVNLKSASIPKSVTKIGNYAFGYVYDEFNMPVVNADFTIKCYKDSAADTYAKNNKLKVDYIDVEHVAAKAADCTQDGNIEYWVYNEKYYSDKELTTEITKDKTVVKASHSFPEKWSVVKQPTIVGAGEESRKCTVCGLTETRPYGTALVTDRAAGKNRFATSLEIAEKFKNANAGKPLENIIIASGTDFADALSATYLANKKNAPILITAGDTKSIIDPIYSFIDKSCVKNANVFIIGGVNVVPETVVNTLKAKGYNVKRLAGRNRFLTNIEVLKEAGVKDEELLIASGTDYADALSASAVGKPILLVSGKAAGMTADQKNYLKTLSSKNGYVIGGANAVSSGIEKDAKAFMNVQRVMGQNRFETSVAVAEKFFKKPTAVAVAYGLNYPDGLCGGPLAFAYGCPLLLTADTRPDAAVNYAKSVSVKSAVTFGGISLVSDKTINKIIGK